MIGGRPDNAITRMWLDSEAAVHAGDVAWTVLRPSGFQSNALRWRPQLADGDVVREPWPDVPIAVIDPADIAAVAAVALTGGGHAGEALELSGPEPLTPGVQVAQLADALGRPLYFEPLDDAAARERMGDSPQTDAQFRFFSDGEFDDARVVDTVRAVTGRAPGRFADWARRHAADF